MKTLNPVLNIIGLLLCGLAAIMLAPALVDLAVNREESAAFLASALATGTLGAMLALATWRREPLLLDVRQAFMLTGGSWLAVSAMAALPFLGSHLDYADAVFETISGLTTTGSTVISALDRHPPGILLWRALLQWIGGVGIVVMAIVLLPFLRVGGMQLFRAESAAATEKVLSSAFGLVARIVAIYVTLTVACVFAYMAVGMSPFDAVCHALATVSTGGFSTHDASIGHFGSAWVEWVAVAFMLAGALPFVVYIKAVRESPWALWHDPQVRALLIFLLLACLFGGAWLSVTRELSFDTAFRVVTFNIVSIVTTTGFASEDYLLWGTGAAAGFFVLTFVGGCAGSTSGGIKMYRHVVVAKLVRHQLLRLSHPNRVDVLRYDGKRLPEDVPGAVLAFLAVYVATVAGFSVALGLMGLDFVTALSAAATAISNVGPGLGDIIGPSGTFMDVPDAAKWLLCVAMLLGRLEVFAILLLFDPAFWRS